MGLERRESEYMMKDLGWTVHVRTQTTKLYGFKTLVLFKHTQWEIID